MILFFSYTLQLVCENSPETEEGMETSQKEKFIHPCYIFSIIVERKKPGKLHGPFSFVTTLDTISQTFRTGIFSCINSENTNI